MCHATKVTMHQQDHFYKYNWALLQRLTQLHLELIGKILKTELHVLCKFKSFLLNHKRWIINSEPAEGLWQTAAAPVTAFRNQIKEDFWFACRYPSQLHRVGNKLKKNKYRMTNNTLHLASLTFLYTQQLFLSLSITFKNKVSEPLNTSKRGM